MSTQLFSNDATLEVLDPDTLTLHPVVFLFPELSTMEFDALVNSIRAHGQIDPVWITNENEVIDGRHRWRAQKKLGAPVQCRRLKNYAPELLTSIIDHCIAQNITRRHMNKDQRAVVAATMEQKRIDAVAAQERGELSLHGGTGFSWNSFEELLETFRIKKTYYDRAKQLVDYGQPEMVEACANGTVTLSTGAYTARKTKPFTNGEVKKCLAANDPERAIHLHCQEKYAKQNERVCKRRMPDYVPPSEDYIFVSEICSDLVFFESDEHNWHYESRFQSINFASVWIENPSEIAELLESVEKKHQVAGRIIAKLKASRPADLPLADTA